MDGEGESKMTNVNLIMSTLDLNKYEAMLLNELIKENPLQTRQINERSGLPRSRVYDVGRNLKRKGYITIEEPKMIKAEIVRERRFKKDRVDTVNRTVPTTFRILSRGEIIKNVRANLQAELKSLNNALSIIFKSEVKNE